MAREIRIRRWDPKKLPNRSSVILVIGKPATGKTTLIRDLLRQTRCKDGIVFSPFEGGEGKEYRNLGRNFRLLNQFEESKAEYYLNEAKRESQALREIDRYDQRVTKVWALDNCVPDRDFRRSSILRNIFMNGRHFRMTMMIGIPPAMAIPPAMRCNTDYIFMLREPQLSNRRRLYDHYGGIFPCFEDFCNVMDRCTRNYRALVIDNSARSYKIEDCVHWYKAGFRSPEIWRRFARKLTGKRCLENNGIINDVSEMVMKYI
jgi:hypothetical protein